MKEKNPYFVLKQVIGDFYDCDLPFEMLDSPVSLKKIALESIKLINTSVIKDIDYKFEPHGYSLAIILADSSMTLHSWPEEKFVSVDVFTCSERADPFKGLEYFKENLKPKSFKIHEIKRK